MKRTARSRVDEPLGPDVVEERFEQLVLVREFGGIRGRGVCEMLLHSAGVYG